MKSVILITRNYPYGIRTDFLSHEIRFLAERFDRVTLAPMTAKGDMASLPANVLTDASLARLLTPLGLIRQLFGRLSWSLLTSEIAALRKQPSFIGLIRTLVAIARANAIFHWAHNVETPSLVYVYWLGPAVVGFRRRWPDATIIARGHGADIYVERHHPPRIPLQNEIVESVDKIYACSEHGQKYLMKLFSTHWSKFEVSRLGIENPYELPKESSSETLRIVTISNLISVKRPDLLARTIVSVCQTHSSVIWRHYGVGPLLKQVLAIIHGANLTNLEFEFKGQVANDVLIYDLTHEPWGVFVNVSESEGAPVSLMEAQSAGIPSVLTDVGGSSEIVDKNHNMVISPESSPAQIAAAILDAWNTPWEWRELRRERWRLNYSVDNYRTFADSIYSLIQE